jgi:multidrug resistance efflux pump
MRFAMRSLFGMMLLVLTLGLLAMAVGTISGALATRNADERGREPARERVFAVNVATFEAVTAKPVLTAWGDLRSARTLELRAEAGGTLIELAPGFRDGGRIAAGETLWRIDPADAETALELARSDHAAAIAEEAEALAGLALAREERAASERQRDLRAQSLARAEDLSGRGVGTAAALEDAELALATAEQAVTGRRLALAQAEARIGRSAIATARAAIRMAEAERILADTVAAAPFDGVLTEVDAVLGRLVTTNEKLGVLLDPTALEVAFRVSNGEFARIADAAGDVMPLDVTAILAADGAEVAVAGRIDRTGASSVAGQSGRLVYAALETERLGLMRPGDFMTVRVEEPSLTGVAVLPATAVDAEGGVLLLGEDGRLEAARVTVLRRQGDEVIVADAPFGREFVTERQPQLGAGILVRPLRDGVPEAEAMVRLSPERRAGLIEAVRANGRMPEEAKARILATLESDEVPAAMVDRLESRRSGG